MIEKVRVSLWDIFSFFLSGMLFAAVAICIGFAFWPNHTEILVNPALTAAPSLQIIGGTLLFTMIGMLVEPLANYFDSIVTERLFFWAARPKRKHRDEEEALKNHISSRYMGSLNGLIENPYGICKEYVETKQLSTTFMVYLSRYGFYRNCAFVTFLSLIVLLWQLNGCIPRIIAMLTCLTLIAAFKRRSADFYSLMAPSVYRAFLIDKNSWSQTKET